MNIRIFRSPLYGRMTSILLLSLIAIAGTAQDNARPVVVVKAELSAAGSAKLVLTGTVTSPRRANLSARIGGLVEKMEVDAGSVVKKGEVLLKLDSKLADLDLELIEAEFEQSEIEATDAKRQFEEVVKLTKVGGFSQSEFLTKKTELELSEINLKQLSARKSQILERIARHQLIAPFDGVIGRKLSEEGEWVATGTPVLELIEMNNLRFDIQVPQESLVQIKNAGKVTVRLDAYPQKNFEAELTAVVPVKDSISRTFLTRLDLNDPDELAAPGMSGTATIESRPQSGGFVEIPRDAVVRFPDGTARVWVVKDDGIGSHAVSRLVETAGQLGEMARIVKGIEAGEVVVLKGNEGLRENQKVVVQPSPASAQ